MWTIWRLYRLFAFLDIIGGTISLALTPIVLFLETPSIIVTTSHLIQIACSPMVIRYGIRLYGRKMPPIHDPGLINHIDLVLYNHEKMDLLSIHFMIALCVYPMFMAFFAVPALMIAIWIHDTEIIAHDLQNGKLRLRFDPDAASIPKLILLPYVIVMQTLEHMVFKSWVLLLGMLPYTIWMIVYVTLSLAKRRGLPLVQGSLVMVR